MEPSSLEAASLATDRTLAVASLAADRTLVAASLADHMAINTFSFKIILFYLL